jgi:hypothetical protein
VVTADCWSRLRAARARGLGAFVAVLVVAGVAELAAMAFGLMGLRRLTEGGRTMGAAVPVSPVSVPLPVAPQPAISPPGGWRMGTPPEPAERGSAHHLVMGRIRRSPVTVPQR